MSNKLIIFDTTLRDGEQSPGASMTKDEKIRIAKVLEKMRGNKYKYKIHNKIYPIQHVLERDALR
jgi:hypothetical protein